MMEKTLHRILVMGFLILLNSTLFAQKKNERFQYHIHPAGSKITVDGHQTEEAWKDAETASDFYMVLPMDTSHAKVRTDVKMTYDSLNLYLLAICYHEPRRFLVESLRRDFVFGKNDNFLVFIDPFDDQTNGFSFGANAAGAQWDGTMYEGGKVDLSWDNKWKSAVSYDSEKWIFEASIPFKSIRYKNGILNWGINFSRLDIKVPEKSAWAPVPRQFPTASLAYTGQLLWDQPPPAAKTNFSIIPYVLGGISKDYENNLSTQYNREAGLDAKIAITSSLNADITVNPDFSQVEVDKQVTNLDRFELFFPERRQFFLENADLFGNFGYANIRPFFSRRIGLGVPIRFGARISGKLDKNWRIGLMDMKTGKVDESGLPAQNFTVMALQRKVFSRSNIGVLFVNKESLSYSPGKDSTKPVYSLYNRNLGLEYNLASSNNLWTGKTMLLKSFSPDTSGKDWVHAANLQYSSRRWTLIWQHEFVGRRFNAEVGYVPRNGYIRFYPQAARLFFPSKGPLVSHGPKLLISYYFNESMRRTDNSSRLYYMFNFRDQQTADVWIGNDFVELLKPFDPTNSGKDSLPAGSRHRANAWGFDYVSRPQQLFTFSLSSYIGGYYSKGKIVNLISDMGYRIQPYASIGLSTTFSYIQLPQPWGTNIFWLLGPRIDITMTNKLFFTTFLQYNDQSKNINLNTRFQWRYSPASDLYIVYTDNYYPAPLSVRNRAIVLKFTYWWNL